MQSIINIAKFNSKFTVILLFIFVVTLFQSCQPAVRFTSKSDTQKSSKIANAKKSAVDTKESRTEKQIEIEKMDFTTGDDFVDEIILTAESWLGVPYKFGGESKSGADCSGFVMQVFSDSGINLPRTSRQQFEFAAPVNFVEKKAGDLIFFKNKGTVNHVGIYLGKGYMIHASTSSGVIRQSIHDSYFINRVAGVGRISKKITQKK